MIAQAPEFAAHFDEGDGPKHVPWWAAGWQNGTCMFVDAAAELFDVRRAPSQHGVIGRGLVELTWKKRRRTQGWLRP